MGSDPLADEIAEAVGDDLKLLLKLCEDFRALVELVRETTARHHELYRIWMETFAADGERTGDEAGFVPKFVKK